MDSHAWSRKTIICLAILLMMLGMASGVFFIRQAFATGTGSISGAVYGSEGENPPLEGIEVVLNNEYSEQVGDPVYTDEYGAYSFTGLDDGIYYVQFTESIHRFSGDTDDMEIIDGEPIEAEDVFLNPGGSISGTVTAGTPLEGTKVTPFLTNRYTQVRDGVWTDEYGHYQLGPFEGGDYYIKFEDSVYGVQWYNLIDDNGDYTEVPVTVFEDTDGINASFTPNSTIYGTITEKDSSPTVNLEGCGVGIYTLSGVFEKTAVTDSSGNYSVTALPSGYHKVIILCIDNVHFSEWYHDAADIGEATQVYVARGDSAEVNESLTKGATISGTVKEQGTGNNIAGCEVNVYQSGSYEAPVAFATTNASGGYTCGPLDTGSYKVQFLDGDDHLEEWFDDKADSTAADAISGMQARLGFSVLNHGFT